MVIDVASSAGLRHGFKGCCPSAWPTDGPREEKKRRKVFISGNCEAQSDITWEVGGVDQITVSLAQGIRYLNPALGALTSLK